MFRKYQYQEAKKFLKENKAKEIKSFSTPSFTNTLYQLENGEQWQESESHLEAPEDDYTLQKVVNS